MANQTAGHQRVSSDGQDDRIKPGDFGSGGATYYVVIIKNMLVHMWDFQIDILVKHHDLIQLV